MSNEMVASLKKEKEKLYTTNISTAHQKMLVELVTHYKNTLGFGISHRSVVEKAIADLYKKTVTPLAVE